VTWPWEIVERDHELQNPTSAEKIRLLGDYLRLAPGKRVLDTACGKAGPARILAAEFGCSVTGVELREAFADEGRAAVAVDGLDALVTIETGDAAAFPLEPEAWDAALCLGASFVWGHIGEAAEALVPAVKAGGYVAVGEPYWRRWPLIAGIDDMGYVDLASTVQRFVGAGVALTGVIAASEDDWDRYESRHWRAVEEWVAENPDDPHGADFRATHEERLADYFSVKREQLGWAIFVGRKS
jgi:SAM-dependent methyltransferase